MLSTKTAVEQTLKIGFVSSSLFCAISAVSITTIAAMLAKIFGASTIITLLVLWLSGFVAIKTANHVAERMFSGTEQTIKEIYSHQWKYSN